MVQKTYISAIFSNNFNKYGPKSIIFGTSHQFSCTQLACKTWQKQLKQNLLTLGRICSCYLNMYLHSGFWTTTVYVHNYKCTTEIATHQSDFNYW